MVSDAPYRLRLLEADLRCLRDGLFPGDSREAVAFALCGMAKTAFGTELLVREVFHLPGSAYRSRSGLHVDWSTESLLPILGRLRDERLCLLKCHSHPGGKAAFSQVDDKSDRALLPHFYGWYPDGLHGSLVLSENAVMARVVTPEGEFVSIDTIRVVGDTWQDFTSPSTPVLDPAQQRLRQAFGEGTYTALRGLRIGVVGVSGTGSLVSEALARTGVGHLVLVDPEPVEVVNLNRVLHTTPADASLGRRKVDIAADAIVAMGLETKVTILTQSLHSPAVIQALAGCDVVIGCVDNREARQILCRLAAFYLLPYLDTGVAIHATDTGDIQSVTAAIHYLRPGQSFLSRGVFDEEALRAEALARSDPSHHAELAGAGYVSGVQVDRPAVMPLNMVAAGWVVMDLLDRVHAYRDAGQRQYLDETFLSIDLGFVQGRNDSSLCPSLVRCIGRGDMVPLLGLPALSTGEVAA